MNLLNQLLAFLTSKAIAIRPYLVSSLKPLFKRLLLGLYICSTLVSPLALASPTSPAFKTAYKAWEKAYKEGYTNRSVFVYIDFTKPSNSPRFYVYDVNLGEFLMVTYVAHGVGSGKGNKTETFSNTPNSKATSLGVQITAEYYQGKHGQVLRMKGLEPWNSNVYPRYIEIHGASYVSSKRVGTSWGCYAIPNYNIKTALYIIQPGTILVSYSNNSNWLNNSKFLN